MEDTSNVVHMSSHFQHSTTHNTRQHPPFIQRLIHMYTITPAGCMVPHPGVADVHPIGGEPGLDLGGVVDVEEVCASKLNTQGGAGGGVMGGRRRGRGMMGGGRGSGREVIGRRGEAGRSDGRRRRGIRREG